MGHSAGGVFTQLMLDRGYGAVGVAINSAATEGVTEVKEYPGYAHLLPAQKGWEQIADDALAWAVEYAR
jgi:hypothetical protein